MIAIPYSVGTVVDHHVALMEDHGFWKGICSGSKAECEDAVATYRKKRPYNFRMYRIEHHVTAITEVFDILPDKL